MNKPRAKINYYVAFENVEPELVKLYEVDRFFSGNCTWDTTHPNKQTNKIVKKKYISLSEHKKKYWSYKFSVVSYAVYLSLSVNRLVEFVIFFLVFLWFRVAMDINWPRAKNEIKMRLLLLFQKLLTNELFSCEHTKVEENTKFNWKRT